MHKIRAFYLSLILAILAALSPAAFADWVAINGSKNFFYYPKSLKTQGKFAKIWGMVNYDEVAISNVLPKSKKVFLDIDCHEGQVKSLAFVFYTEKMGKGDVLTENNYATGPWRWVHPGSFDEALFNISCKSNAGEVTDQTNNAPEDSLDAEEEIVDESKN